MLYFSEKAIKAFYAAILIRALKDYRKRPYRIDVMNWVVDEQETFPQCAEALNIPVQQLRIMMVDKMIEIDTTGILFKNGELRVNKTKERNRT